MTDKKILSVDCEAGGLTATTAARRLSLAALRDAVMEVIYTGLRQTPGDEIASDAIQEDVDVIGLSILSGAHNTLCPRLIELLRGKGMNDVTILIGGIISGSRYLCP